MMFVALGTILDNILTDSNSAASHRWLGVGPENMTSASKGTEAEVLAGRLNARGSWCRRMKKCSCVTSYTRCDFKYEYKTIPYFSNERMRTFLGGPACMCRLLRQ